MQSTSLCVGMVQFPAAPERVTNINTALRLATQAALQGAQIVAFHEMFMLPWAFAVKQDSRALADTADSPIWEPFRMLARQQRVVLVCSYYEDGGADRFYNAAHVIDATGETAGNYRKHHLPPDNERFHFALPDDPIRAIDTAYGRIGVYICWENFVPEGARALALQGVNVVFAPTAASSQANRYRWELALRANAMTNSVYWVRLNRIEPPFYGRSFIVAPNGQYVVDPLGVEEGITLTTLDLSLIEQERKEWTYFTDRRPAHYATLSLDTGSGV